MHLPLSLQPIPYQGSKRSLAPRICQVFPRGIMTLYEPFAGSAAISVYAAHHELAEKFVIGDVYAELIDLWNLIINEPAYLAERYNSIWQKQFTVGPSHFNEVRASYNEDRDPVALLYLIARCVKNAVRFNKKGHFTQSADKRRTGMNPEKLSRTVHTISTLLRGRTTLFKGDFHECVQTARQADLVYMDPPYQGTSNGPDKRYAAQLGRETLIETLHHLNSKDVPFILSYDGQSGEKSYGEALPSSISADHLLLHAGRSSQATLIGRDEATIESLYISKALGMGHFDIFHQRAAQMPLFG